jgi:hypothetical protein
VEMFLLKKITLSSRNIHYLLIISTSLLEDGGCLLTCIRKKLGLLGLLKEDSSSRLREVNNRRELINRTRSRRQRKKMRRMISIYLEK